MNNSNNITIGNYFIFIIVTAFTSAKYIESFRYKNNQSPFHIYRIDNSKITLYNDTYIHM